MKNFIMDKRYIIKLISDITMSLSFDNTMNFECKMSEGLYGPFLCTKLSGVPP